MAVQGRQAPEENCESLRGLTALARQKSESEAVKKTGSSRFLVGTFSQFRQRTGEDFQLEVLLIA
jgi:hypothetical protein